MSWITLIIGAQKFQHNPKWNLRVPLISRWQQFEGVDKENH